MIICTNVISIHALLAESDLWAWMGDLSYEYFYPRSPCGERQHAQPPKRPKTHISIHALLAESDCFFCVKLRLLLIFLSTLSLRRATDSTNADLRRHRDFYPRSPCGERPLLSTQNNHNFAISIHALLAESDCFARCRYWA